MTPRIASTPVRQLSTIQLTLSVTAIATRQMPKTVKKITDRRRPRNHAKKNTGNADAELSAD